jgi:hypothetical protein
MLRCFFASRFRWLAPGGLHENRAADAVHAGSRFSRAANLATPGYERIDRSEDSLAAVS